MGCAHEAAGYVVRVIETHYGCRMWFFWHDGIGEWVRELDRATRYTHAQAVSLAERLSASHEVEAAAVSEASLQPD